jgi:hypothetical protein
LAEAQARRRRLEEVVAEVEPGTVIERREAKRAQSRSPTLRNFPAPKWDDGAASALGLMCGNNTGTSPVPGKRSGFERPSRTVQTELHPRGRVLGDQGFLNEGTETGFEEGRGP